MQIPSVSIYNRLRAQWEIASVASSVLRFLTVLTVTLQDTQNSYLQWCPGVFFFFPAVRVVAAAVWQGKGGLLILFMALL